MIDETLTMIPGPTPVHPRILAALARPTVSHVAPAFVKEFREALDAFRGLCQSASGQPFVVSGAGTLAMEMALVNVVAPGEKILVISHGYFGDRYADLAAAFGISCDVLRSEWGRAVPPEELARKLAEGKYAAVTITHVDTSTGTASPVEDYVRLLRGRDELVILDGVCATGGIDEPFDRWGIDVLLTAAQKAIGAPPGLALCLFSKRAMERRRSRASVPAADRTNSRVAPIADPFQPAVLRMIRQTIEAGRGGGIGVALCGELAADPLAAPLLLGLGLEEFSVSAPLIPELKRAISRWSAPEAEGVDRKSVV